MATRTLDPHASISGHVWLYEGKRGNTWCAKWRDQQGQHEKRLGPDWTGKGSPRRASCANDRPKNASTRSSSTLDAGSCARSAPAIRSRTSPGTGSTGDRSSVTGRPARRSITDRSSSRTCSTRSAPNA